MKHDKQGSVLLGILLLLTGLLSIGIALSSAVSSSSIKVQKQYHKLSALAFAEAGVNKGLWKINTEDTAYGSGAGGILESDIPGGEYRVKVTPCTVGATDCRYIESTGYVPSEASPQAQKTVRVKINSVQGNTDLVFNYSAQSNANQILIGSSAKIKGSAYSNGPIYMETKGIITGNAISYGSTPTTSYIYGANKAEINGNAAAYAITPSTNFVDGIQTIGEYPKAQKPPIDPDELEDTINAWESAAESGGTFPTTGRANKVITDKISTLGPIRINGDLIIDNNAELRLTGTIWVNGNIYLDNGSRVYLDPSYENSSGVMIADYKTDRNDWTQGRISLKNGSTVSGTDKNNPKTPSFTLMFSTQSPMAPAAPSNWINYPAIDVSNNVHGGVYYAPFGSFVLYNVAQIRAVVANGIILKNNAILDYDSNWGNSSISYGPAGKWTITEWLIID